MADQIRNVFISHRHEDDDGLKDLKKLVKQHGMECRDYSIRADNPNNAHNEDYIKYQYSPLEYSRPVAWSSTSPIGRGTVNG